MTHNAENGPPREAEPGELVHDRGCDPDTGWFIVGEDGYFDVLNACWCEPQDGDAPWTTEWFDLFGTVLDLIATRPIPPGSTCGYRGCLLPPLHDEPHQYPRPIPPGEEQGL